MIRIEFTADDIARTRVLPTLGPFAETVLGVGSVRMARPGRVSAPWQAATRGRYARAVADLAGFFSPTPTVQLDLFSRIAPAAEFDEGAEGLLAMPDQAFRDEVEVTRCRTTPSWLRGIERAELPARRRMVDVLERLHRETVLPHWAAITTVLDAERNRLQRLLVEGGVDRLLSSLHPLARWSSPVLELPAAGRWTSEPQWSRLGGAGLLVVPSVFCAFGPVPYFPYDGRPGVLLYPAVPADELARLWAMTRSTTALAVLLGRTRAAALEAIQAGCTTTELARRIGVSPASASQHATALRDAGLVASRRDRNRMLHSLTRLGLALLEAPRS